MATALQAFILKKPAFTRRAALAFARQHDALTIEETAQSYRVRVREPGSLRARGFRRFRTMPVNQSITAVIAAKGRAPNPPRGAVGIIPGRVEEVRYLRIASQHPGAYKHRFGPGAVMFAMKNGDVIIRSMGGKRLWGKY